MPVQSDDDAPNAAGNGSPPPQSVASTGFAPLDAVLQGSRWGGPITYSFPNSAGDYQSTHFSDADDDFFSAEDEGFSKLTALQQLAVHFALDTAPHGDPAAAAGFSVEGFTRLNITFTSGFTGTGTLRFANSTDAATAYANFPNWSDPGDNLANGDVFFGTGQTGAYNVQAPRAGNYAWLTTLHEIGHSLGLKHTHVPDFGNPQMPAAFDSPEFTVMTYRSFVNDPDTQGYETGVTSFAQTYMMQDIQALQYMYGADYTTNAGNTVYKWLPNSGKTFVNGAVAIAPVANKIFATIWDGGGNDTYDLSAYRSAVNIDLAPGGFSSFTNAQKAILDSGTGLRARGNIFNAYEFLGDPRSGIENARGGTGNDTIKGNDLNNRLDGGAGADHLFGFSGNDRLIAGGGNGDQLHGDGGNDTYVLGFQTVGIFELSGNDTIVSPKTRSLAALGFIENLLLTGTTNINATGNNIANRLSGNSGANTLIGANGNDKLIGQGGSDRLLGGSGRDILTGGANADDFRYTSISQSGTTASTRDRITDFVHLVDEIDLSAIDANGAAAGSPSFTFRGTAAFNGGRGQVRYTKENPGGTVNDKTIVQVDINGDRVADMTIELRGLINLTPTDFHF